MSLICHHVSQKYSEMASEIIVNGITYNVVQINGQKIAEVTNYFGPAAPENAEVSLRLCPLGRPT